MSEKNIEAVKEFYAALNRNDVPATLKHFDPQCVRVEFEGTPMAGTYRGLAGIKAHFEKSRDTWAEGACEPERFQAAGDKVIAFVHVKVKLKAGGKRVEGRVADVFGFTNGKITEFRSFLEAKEAAKWAGTVL